MPDLRAIKRANFRGRSYRMVWRKPIERKSEQKTDQWIVGMCDHPATKGRTMHIGTNQPPIMLLDTTIHESLHACFPDADEPAVAETSNSIMRLLMRMGINVEFTPEKRNSYDWGPCTL